MDPTLRRRVVVRGRVQGVFFRVTCAREARAHGVTGWVRNREDGAVEAVFEGSTAPVLAMVEWMRRGPELARVERAEVLDEAPAGDPSFRVLG